MQLGVTAFLTDRSMGPAAFAAAAEERGFATLYLPEHTHLPVAAATPPGLVAGVRAEDYRRSLDPMAALSFAAAATTRLRIGTGVCLVAQHDPIVLAKQVATLDLLSAGRLVLGVGYGWNAAELADHHVAFAERRAVTHDKLACMRALWAADPAEYHGRYVDLPACHALPKPVQVPHPPLLLGGAAGPKLFAAVAEHFDGWMPIGGAGLAAALPALAEALAAAGRSLADVAVVPFGTLPSEAKLEHFAEIGVTETVLRVPAGPADEMLAVLDDYRRYLA